MWEQESEQCEECGQNFWPEHVTDRGVCVLCDMAEDLDQFGSRLPDPINPSGHSDL